MDFQIGEKFRFTRLNKLIDFLTQLIKKLFSPITKLLNDIDNNYSDQSAIKKTLIGLFQLRIVICIAVIAIAVCSACFFAARNDGESSAVMSLNYEESAKGLNPNSTRFNVYELKSPDVVEKMLYYCGVNADDVDMDKLIDSITIKPTNSKGFSPDEYYIATSYRITMKKVDDIKDVSTHDLLVYLCKAYTDVFYDRYAENRSVLDFDVEEFDDLEFLLVADLLKLKAEQQSKYLNTRVKQSKTFTDGSSDATFKSLSEEVEDFKNYDIEGYRSFVLQTGIAHDKAHFQRVLDYVNLIEGIKFNKDMASYDVRYDGIEIFNEAMISIVMIPTVDREKNNYYMSKTKTAMDYMAKQADDHLATAQETAKKILTNEDIMVKMQAGQNEPSDAEKANKMIKDMQVKFNKLGRQIESIDKAYIKYKTKDYVTFQISGSSLMQKIRPDMLFTIIVVFMAGCFVAMWIRFRYFSEVSGGVKR